MHENVLFLPNVIKKRCFEWKLESDLYNDKKYMHYIFFPQTQT